MTLQETLAARRAAGRARIAADALAVMDADTEALRASAMADAALAVGEPFPEFALPDATGTPVESGPLLAAGPLVVSFYRGNWCPYCNLELAALGALQDDFAAAGAALVAVSPQVPDEGGAASETHGLTFPVLSDVGNVLAEQAGLVHRLSPGVASFYRDRGYDLVTRNGGDDEHLPLPGTFVVATDGTVAWRFVNVDYTRRAEPAEVLEVVRGLA